MNQHERDLDLIEVILEDAHVLHQRIEHFSMTREMFVNDHTVEGEIAYDAVMSPVFRIAEDALHLSEEVTSLFPSYPWGNIRGFRNFVAHGYREVDRAVAWKVVENDIPELAENLQQYLLGISGIAEKLSEGHAANLDECVTEDELDW